MNNIKILVGLAVMAIYGVTLSHSISCYYCGDKETCKNPPLGECNSLLANITRSYLDVFHRNVDMSATSGNFDCYREYIKGTYGEVYYKGCIYSETDGCSLQLRNFYESEKQEFSCNQCNNKNGCNPAGRAKLYYGLPVIVLLFAVFGKLVWSI